MTYVCGLDLGQSQDYTALVVAERHPPEGAEPARYHVRHLERFALGTAYPTIVSQVHALLRRPSLQGQCTVVIDATGVGKPVVDLLRQAGLAPIAVTIHGGDQVHAEGANYRVPKRDLVSVMQVLLQQRRLRIAQALPQAETLVQEILNFRVKIDPQTVAATSTILVSSSMDQGVILHSARQTAELYGGQILGLMRLQA